MRHVLLGVLIGVLGVAVPHGSTDAGAQLSGAAFMWPNPSGDPFAGFVGPWRVNRTQLGEPAGISVHYAVLCYTPNQGTNTDFARMVIAVVADPVTLVKIRDAASAAAVAKCAEDGITVLPQNVIMPAVTQGQ